MDGEDIRIWLEIGYKHETINIKETFSAIGSRGQNVCTNTIESANSSIKRKARKLNLLKCWKTNQELIENKVQELVWRLH